MAANSSSLKRTLTLPTLIIYGVGSIFGAGIYAVIGEVVEKSGQWIWLSFIISFVISFLTALCYAELVSKYPKSGAEVHFLQQAFHQSWLSSLIGWLVFAACVVSMATLTHAFANCFKDLWSHMYVFPIYIVFPLLLGLINFWGIRESSGFNIIATIIEFSGLLLVVIAGIYFLTGSGSSINKEAPTLLSFDIIGICQGAALAFFAFIGFEDMVNISEEVKKPKKTIPLAIITACFITGFFYIVISWLSSVIIEPQNLKSSSPLIEIVEKSDLSIPSVFFIFIAIFAVSNTALLNSITASRLLYGMGQQNMLPKFFTVVHRKRKTPYISIVCVIICAILLAIFFSLESLAGATNMVLLIIFFGVSLSLFKIKIQEYSREKKSMKKKFSIPLIFPLLAIMGNLSIMFFLPFKSQLIAFCVIIAGFIVLQSYKRLYKS